MKVEFLNQIWIIRGHDEKHSKMDSNHRPGRKVQFGRRRPRKVHSGQHQPRKVQRSTSTVLFKKNYFETLKFLKIFIFHYFRIWIVIFFIGHEKCHWHQPLHFSRSTSTSTSWKSAVWLKRAVWLTVDVNGCIILGRLHAGCAFHQALQNNFWILFVNK